MAKIGQLMLDGGRWQEQQIVSQPWVERSTSPLQFTDQDGYGYQWWTAEMSVNGTAIRVHSARGNGGQYIFIVPELSAVVVFTAGNYYPLNQSAPFRYLAQAVLPSMM